MTIFIRLTGSTSLELWWQSCTTELVHQYIRWHLQYHGIYYSLYLQSNLCSMLFCKFEHLLWLLEAENLINPSCRRCEVETQSPLDWWNIDSLCTSEGNFKYQFTGPKRGIIFTFILISPFLSCLGLSLDKLTQDIHVPVWNETIAKWINNSQGWRQQIRCIVKCCGWKSRLRSVHLCNTYFETQSFKKC